MLHIPGVQTSITSNSFEIEYPQCVYCCFQILRRIGPCQTHQSTCTGNCQHCQGHVLYYLLSYSYVTCCNCFCSQFLETEKLGLSTIHSWEFQPSFSTRKGGRSKCGDAPSVDRQNAASFVHKWFKQESYLQALAQHACASTTKIDQNTEHVVRCFELTKRCFAVKEVQVSAVALIAKRVINPKLRTARVTAGDLTAAVSLSNHTVYRTAFQKVGDQLSGLSLLSWGCCRLDPWLQTAVRSPPPLEGCWIFRYRGFEWTTLVAYEHNTWQLMKLHDRRIKRGLHVLLPYKLHTVPHVLIRSFKETS